MINLMGDKASAKATMKKAGVPTVPGSEGILASFDCVDSLSGATDLFKRRKAIL